MSAQERFDSLDGTSVLFTTLAPSGVSTMPCVPPAPITPAAIVTVPVTPVT